MEWNNIEEMFRELHSNDIDYIILRNYEEIDEENFYTSGHADIDFLTTDGKKFARTIHATPRFIKNDGIHYKVVINGTEVIIDTRSVGDGYYDKKWEKNLLANKVLKNNRFYIADDINYYYSLIYHAILQKKSLADDYLFRLNKMASQMGINAKNQADHLAELDNYMRNQGYFYTIPYDIHVPLQKELIDHKRIKKQINVILRDMYIKSLQIGSKVKRSFINKK